MRRITSLIMQVTYIMGVLAVVLSLVYASTSRVPNPLHVTTRGCLVFAMTLFLCAIASHLVARQESK